ncbi:zinc finger protein RFP-like isoform X2 [Hemicordylus capensis]|uniref:zinc finger protein RFP-like isoform X2 n=1 Tax=Hemicordylus capensis TaxID=884348 RepID=UPI00230241E6|nr:zinc finger protein RFP-like isoform X2 [Hemicordylus capensis]
MTTTAESKDPCAVCMQYCKRLVSTDSVNICRACTAESMGSVTKERSCLQTTTAEGPQERSPRQTPERKRIQLAKWLRFQANGKFGGESLCNKHQEPLKVFCMEDYTLLCLVCEKSKQHRTHAVLPLEEAAEDYKEDLKMERQKIVLQFQKLRRFLEEQEDLFLTQLAELEKEMENVQQENCIQLSDTVSLLNSCISDLEENCQRPASEFLQDLKKTLSWYEKGNFCRPMEIQPSLEKEVNALSQKSIVLMEYLKAFKEMLAIEMRREKAPFLNAVVQAQADQPQLIRLVMYADALRTGTIANVTLDPRTANPQLFVSPDQKTVKYGDRLQVLPDNPERFDLELFVLGCEGFCSGKHCWVVNVEEGQSWAIGIARESVKRKGYINLSPEQGIWAVEQCWGQFQALTSHWTPLSLFRKPKRICVSLDYERGWVAFFDADLDAPLFSFPPISFSQEKIYPWFWVGPGSHLSMCL